MPSDYLVSPESQHRFRVLTQVGALRGIAEEFEEYIQEVATDEKIPGLLVAIGALRYTAHKLEDELNG